MCSTIACDTARCKRIFIRGLTKETHGNGTGIGLSEFTNQRTIDGIDRNMTAINCITGNHPTGAMLPIAYPTDREVVTAALQTIGLTEPPDARIIQIADTLRLAECLVSETYAKQWAGRKDLEIVSGPTSIAFDENGNLRPVLTSGH